MNQRIPVRLKDFFKKIMKKDKLVMIFLVGILLIIINIPTKKSDEGIKKEETKTAEDSYLDYISMLENKLEKLFNETAEVGKAKVILNVKNKGKNILYVQRNYTENTVKENDSNGGSRDSVEIAQEESIVYEDFGNGKSPYVTQEELPEITGVVIIAEGADNANVAAELSEAASALLGISINKIKILKMEA